MREILFKAKRKDNNKWVEGCIWTMLDNSDGPITKKYFIRDKNYSVYGSYSWKDYEVIPDTVSQYTGLTDKNGVKIFEGDLIKCSWLPSCKFEVTFVDACFYLKNIDNRHISFSEVVERIKGNVQGNIEIIGNIFDKKEEEK